jgi:hypothetical protein
MNGERIVARQVAAPPELLRFNFFAICHRPPGNPNNYQTATLCPGVDVQPLECFL